MGGKGKLNIAVYRITNTITGYFYVGASIRYNHRISNHFGYLRKGNHSNYRMQKDFNTYGFDSFKVDILEKPDCDSKELIIREQFYIDTLMPTYNIVPRAGSNPKKIYIKRTGVIYDKVTEYCKIIGVAHTSELSRYKRGWTAWEYCDEKDRIPQIPYKDKKSEEKFRRKYQHLLASAKAGLNPKEDEQE